MATFDDLFPSTSGTATTTPVVQPLTNTTQQPMQAQSTNPLVSSIPVLGDIFNSVTGGGLDTGSGSLMSTLAALGTYFGLGNQEQAITNAGNTAAATANPFGNNRATAGNMLMQSYTDPNFFANNEALKGITNTTTNDVNRAMAAGGYNMSGRQMSELGTRLQDERMKYALPFQQNLGQAAGIQFDPANAANMQLQSTVQAAQLRQNQNAALMNLIGQLFGKQTGTTGQTPGTTPGGGTLPGTINDVINGLPGLNGGGNTGAGEDFGLTGNEDPGSANDPGNNIIGTGTAGAGVAALPGLNIGGTTPVPAPIPAPAPEPAGGTLVNDPGFNDFTGGFDSEIIPSVGDYFAPTPAELAGEGELSSLIGGTGYDIFPATPAELAGEGELSSLIGGTGYDIFPATPADIAGEDELSSLIGGTGYDLSTGASEDFGLTGNEGWYGAPGGTGLETGAGEDFGLTGNEGWFDMPVSETSGIPVAETPGATAATTAGVADKIAGSVAAAIPAIFLNQAGANPESQTGATLGGIVGGFPGAVLGGLGGGLYGDYRPGGTEDQTKAKNTAIQNYYDDYAKSLGYEDNQAFMKAATDYAAQVFSGPATKHWETRWGYEDGHKVDEGDWVVDSNRTPNLSAAQRPAGMNLQLGSPVTNQAQLDWYVRANSALSDAGYSDAEKRAIGIAPIVRNSAGQWILGGDQPTTSTTNWASAPYTGDV